MNVPGAEGMVCNFDITQEGAEKVTDTVYENHSKMPHNFPPIFVLLKLTCLVTLFDRKLQAFKNSPKCTIFDIFN